MSWSSAESRSDDPFESVVSLNLFKFFREYRNREFLFVRPGGNEGDQLIYLGAEKLGNLAGLSFSTVSHETFVQNKYGPEVVVYLHGGGGYNPIWSGKPMVALQHASEHAGVVIQGPQTYWHDLKFLRDQVVQPILNAQCERLVFMTRESISYDLMQEVLPSSVELVLDHDTALNLQREDLEEFLPQREGIYTLYAIRKDKEATETNYRNYFSVWLDPVGHRRDFEAWVHLHAGAREIVTNRLHSSICGLILGIPTTLVPNSYFKNRAVWEHSLQGREVHWADHVDIALLSRFVHRVGSARRLMSHPRVQRIVRRLNGLN